MYAGQEQWGVCSRSDRPRRVLWHKPQMRVTELQNEVNHLVFLYFTSVGVIQRDAGSADISSKMDEMMREIGECRRRISEYMEDGPLEVELCDDYDDVVLEGREFIRDGFCFLDSMLKTNK